MEEALFEKYSTHVVPTMFIKDKTIVDMTFTQWTVRNVRGEWGFDLDYSESESSGDFDQILFELPNGCHIIDIEGQAGKLWFGGGGRSVPIELCKNRGEMVWNSTTSSSESPVPDVQARA